MSEVQWIRINTNMFDHEKIRLIESLPDADAVLVIWLKLLTLAGRCNDGGLIYITRDIPYNEEMLSTILRRPINTIRLALNEFIKLGMIEIIEGHICVSNWEKHQNAAGLEKMREQNRLRVQKYRHRTDCNENVTLRNGPDKNRIDKNRIDKNKERGFSPPSLDEIQKYLDERNITVFTANGFYDFYQSNGWKVGKNKMRDWKAAVRGWEYRNRNGEKKHTPFNQRNAYLESLSDDQQETFKNKLLGIGYEK